MIRPLTGPLTSLALAVLLLGRTTNGYGDQQLLADLLDRLGKYVGQYEQEISAVVAREDYQQVLLTAGSAPGGSTARKTLADLLVLQSNTLGWLSFRDVYEVDGSPVRDHDERLAALLSNFSADSIFNINPTDVVVSRNINTPMTALLFVTGRNQSHSSFNVSGQAVVDARPVTVLSFNERGRPRLIASTDNAAAFGRLWVDPSTGVIVRSELRLESSFANDQSLAIRITVEYGSVPGIPLLVPIVMDESYELSASRQVIRARAAYSHFRRFNVSVGEAPH